MSPPPVSPAAEHGLRHGFHSRLVLAACHRRERGPLHSSAVGVAVLAWLAPSCVSGCSGFLQSSRCCGLRHFPATSSNSNNRPLLLRGTSTFSPCSTTMVMCSASSALALRLGCLVVLLVALFVSSFTNAAEVEQSFHAVDTPEDPASKVLHESPPPPKSSSLPAIYYYYFFLFIFA